MKSCLCLASRLLCAPRVLAKQRLGTATSISEASFQSDSPAYRQPGGLSYVAALCTSVNWFSCLQTRHGTHSRTMCRLALPKPHIREWGIQSRWVCTSRRSLAGKRDVHSIKPRSGGENLKGGLGCSRGGQVIGFLSSWRPLS